MSAGWTKNLFIAHDIRPIVIVNLEKEKALIRWAFLIEISFIIRLNGDGYLLHPPESFQFPLKVLKH
jgi:hypothetical protein